MSTQQIPNGTKIDSTFKALNSEISFTNSRPTTPLPPLVQTYYYSSESKLQVCAVIFIDSSLEITSVNVYYDNTQKLPVFYVSYDASETEASTFNAYQVNFEIDLIEKPNTIETIVWDEDPINSRGTETTVQPS